MKAKKLVLAVLAMATAVSLFAGCGGGGGDKKSAGGGEKKFINIATGGTSGTYYPLGGALADILNKNVKGANASAQSTGASVANINLLKEGKVDIAFVQNDISYYAVKGLEMFKGKEVKNLKALATLYPETIQIVTTAKTGVKTLADVKGKRVAVGAAGSGTEANARQILEAAGITYDDIKVQYLSFGEAASALKDGNVDVAFVTAGFPTAAIQDLATQHDVVLLPVDAAMADKLIKAARDCAIGGRVALKVNISAQKCSILFVPADGFVYQTDMDDVDQLERITFFYTVKDDADRARQEIWVQKYWMENGRCMVTERFTDGYGKTLAWEGERENADTGLDRIPAFVILNDGLSGDTDGESEVKELMEDDAWYGRLKSANIDTLRKGMNQIVWTSGADPACSQNFRYAPGAYWDIKGDPVQAGINGNAAQV